MRFAEKLQQLRKERGFSQEELAEEIGVSRQAVSKWESGQSYPEMEKLIAVGRLFGVSIDSLVNEESQAEASYGRREDDFSRIKRAMHYEYKSRKILFGVPLVHINLGFGAYRARGIIAIGNIAVGAFPSGWSRWAAFALGCWLWEPSVWRRRLSGCFLRWAESQPVWLRSAVLPLGSSPSAGWPWACSLSGDWRWLPMSPSGDMPVDTSQSVRSQRV